MLLIIRRQTQMHHLSHYLGVRKWIGVHLVVKKETDESERGKKGNLNQLHSTDTPTHLCGTVLLLSVPQASEGFEGVDIFEFPPFLGGR